MDIQCQHQDTALDPSELAALRRLQAVRRQRLGVLLIALGCFWLGVRLAVWIGDASVPMIWVQWVLAAVLPITRSSVALDVLQVAGALLVLEGFRRAWVLHAEL